jgi:hypothetical protein
LRKAGVFLAAINLGLNTVFFGILHRRCEEQNCGWTEVIGHNGQTAE